MKRFLCLLSVLALFSDAACADEYWEVNANMANFWEKNGKQQEKVVTVGTHILEANKIEKRVPIILDRTPKVINACSELNSKFVRISSGILPYMDNDDELAAIISHEINHSLDAYGGVPKWIAVFFNGKHYEYKSDLVGIDLMTKAGYNPVAAIIIMNKISPEPQFDWHFSHPKGTKRVMKMYEYIYKKYPWALDSEMTQNVNYKNFRYVMDKEIKAFEQKDKARQLKNKGML